MKKNDIAICYDFDGTLIPGNMQENSFIPNLGISKEDFWKEVKEEAKNNDMDEVLAYMELMMRKTREKKKPFNKQSLQNHGKTVEFFPGVEKWFSKIDKIGSDLALNIHHFIISSGIDEMIRSSPIGKYFTYIFASGFSYDENKVPKFAARSVNYTTKTQYLFRINKGILNSWDNSINAVMEESERPFPFSRMIYLGDGETDVPAMKMMNYQGGYSICVYPPPKGKRRNSDEIKKEKVAKELHSNNRVQFVAEADYNEDKALFSIVSSLLHRIANEEKYQMNRNA